MFLEKGGITKISVSDNGEGMDGDDALLAFERHATSKVKTDEDLEHISTMGFRGEALASIASVSKVRLTSMPDGSDSASSVYIEGGIIRDVSKRAGKRGTSIEVSDLFFNTPARKKFLKTVQTELKHSVGYLTAMALTFPGIHIKVVHDGREVFNLPGSDLETRIYNLFGKDISGTLVQFDRQLEACSISGHASGLQHHRSSGDQQFIFVNSRLVRNRTLLHAVKSAYEGLPHGRFPFITLFLELPFDEVDVNVHPAKSEVRFRNPGAVHNAVAGIITDALRDNPRLKSVSRPQTTDYMSRVGKSAERFIQRESIGLYGNSSDRKERFIRNSRMETGSVSSSAASEEFLLPRVIGQYKNTYIVAMDEHGLLIVDQHVAHERILYEKLLHDLKKGATEVQGLLSPVVLELSPADFIKYREFSKVLGKTGFDCEEFGESAVAIRAVPALLSGREIDRAFLDILDKLETGAPPEKNLSELLISVACHAAVKKNDRLEKEKMEYLITKLYETGKPTICPHGRPILIRYEHRDIEKDFNRR